MLTGESSLGAWMRAYEVDPVLCRKSGSGRGARELGDAPHHQYAVWDTADKKDETPVGETHHTTGDAKIGDMKVRNTITGQVRTLSEVWADAKNARYTLAENNKVVALEAVPTSTAVEEAVGHIVLAPQIGIVPWAVGEMSSVSWAA